MFLLLMIFSFPETNWSFKSEWFKWFPWLSLSPSKEAVYFSHYSNQEQLSSALTFFHKAGEIREKCLGFLHWELGLSGKTLAETILTETRNLTLYINNCHWQEDDEAASVSGHINGLSAQILKTNGKPVYLHFHSHQFNLVVAASCSIQYVRDVPDKIEEFLFSLVFLSHFKKC